jgi:hypothetical protein
VIAWTGETQCLLNNLNWTATTGNFKCNISPPANASSLLYAQSIVVTVADANNRNLILSVVPSQAKFDRFTWRTLNDCSCSRL